MADDTFAPPMARAFPHAARPRIAGALADAPNRAFSATELADHAGVGRGTFYDHREELVELGVLEFDENHAITRYRLADTAVAQVVRQLNETLGERFAEGDREFADALTDFRT